MVPLLILLLGGLITLPARSQENTTPSLNQLVLNTMRTMPTGGGYSAGSTATGALRNAVQLHEETLAVDAFHAIPSYCSGATYLVFLKVIASLQSEHRISLPPSTLEALLPKGQPDGTGIWGRWNANGPGTARLFAELNLGENFSDLTQARPGDFLKIWWTDSIGSSEHGHSVIFIGTESRGGIPYLSYWSSNVPGGFGIKSVPLSRIHRILFSRLENPGLLANTGSIPPSDHYLYSLQTRSSTSSEMEELCSVKE